MDPFTHDGAPGPNSVHSTRQRQALPVKIPVPSFSAFRAQTPPISVASPVRRKPLPPNASPLLTGPSSGVPVAATRDPEHDDSLTKASPQRPTAGPNRAVWLSQPWKSSPPLVVRDLDRYATATDSWLHAIFTALVDMTKWRIALDILTVSHHLPHTSQKTKEYLL